MRDIKHIVIHCAASVNGDAKVDRAKIDQWHRAKGWRGIGYHYVIEVDGRLAVGRPEEQIGAHVAGENGSSIGICMVGMDRFSEAQWETLRDLVDDLTARYPGAAVWGHRDFSPDKDGDGVIEPWEWFKYCPGFDVSAWRLAGMDPQWDVKHLLPDPEKAVAAVTAREAGFGYVQAIAAVAIVGGLVWLGSLVKNYLEETRTTAHRAGREEALLEVATRDNTQMAAVQKRVLELQAELAEKEARHQADVTRIDQEGTHALRNVEQERDAARRIAARYAGRLRDYGAREALARAAGGGGDAAAAPGAGAGVDPRGPGAEAPGTELSDAAGAFLRGEADRADEVVHDRNALAVRLEACQAIVIADRRP